MKNDDQIYIKALALVLQHCASDATHQPDHIQRVLNLVEYLAEKEGVSTQIDLPSLKLAAIFHDLGSSYRIKKLRRSSDKFKSEEHAKESFKIARKFLQQEGFSPTQIKKIQRIITSHGDSGSNDDLEGHFLHDADLLDGIGAVGMLRIFTFGGQIGRGILGSIEFIKTKTANRQFRTKTGQKLGKKRIKKTLNLLQKAEAELSGQDLL